MSPAGTGVYGKYFTVRLSNTAEQSLRACSLSGLKFSCIEILTIGNGWLMRNSDADEGQTSLNLGVMLQRAAIETERFSSSTEPLAGLKLT